MILEKGYILLSSPAKQIVIHSTSQRSWGSYLWYRGSAENTHWSHHLMQCCESGARSPGWFPCLIDVLHPCITAWLQITRKQVGSLRVCVSVHETTKVPVLLPPHTYIPILAKSLHWSTSGSCKPWLHCLWDPVHEFMVEWKESNATLSPHMQREHSSHTFPRQKQELECADFMSQRANGNSQAVEGE